MNLNTPIVGEAQLTEALIRASTEIVRLETENARLTAQLAEAEAREQKGRDYLVDISGIGSEDPMDFLCAAHAYQRAELDSLRAQLAEREGWVLVPNEPTEAMCNAVSASPSLRFAASAIYAAMIAASPRLHAAENK